MLGITKISATLLVMVMALAACGSADNGGTDVSARVRLGAKNASVQFGNYEIHVSGMLASELTPEIAQSYDIVRSENQGLVNLVILDKAAGESGAPIGGTVQVSAANLNGQLKNMELREIVDGPSVYYIGAISVDDRETVNFDFDVQPDGSNQMLLVRFTYEFYTK